MWTINNNNDNQKNNVIQWVKKTPNIFILTNMNPVLQ